MFLSCVAAWQSLELYSFTLANSCCTVEWKEFIATMRGFNVTFLNLTPHPLEDIAIFHPHSLL
ncbi:MAG TPA: hypothetical protein VMI32_20710 [Candidatus Solibacter sp.]|nr:hypothetical protein [Candidatus Solibacter sp.]